MQVMKASSYTLACLIICSGIRQAQAAAVARRQESHTATTPTTSGTRTESSASSRLSELSTIQNTAKSALSSVPSATIADFTANISILVSSELSPAASTFTASDTAPTNTSAINGPIETYSNTTGNEEKVQPDALPLRPKITPALGVAGVFLILAGFTFTLIGTKNTWIQIFLSSAFVTSLSVAVLLVYVMNPPVRPALQGAYVAAVFITGIILGAGSLIFKEVTEGLGCLFGGFCLSMWLLALRSGGSLQSTGKLILIAVFTTTTYSLSFSHYTRSYGLIGTTSFGGATVAVLGLDCFTRAGLKEFWLYIWDLNEKLFPLNTETYPMTRGIRVEQAIIVLIFCLGVLSQIKPWETIKRRREDKAATQLGRGGESDQVEEETGCSLEQSIKRDSGQLEAVLNDQGESGPNANPDSSPVTGAGTNPQISVSVKEDERGKDPANVIPTNVSTLTANEQAASAETKASTDIEIIMGDEVEAMTPLPGHVGAECAVVVSADHVTDPRIVARPAEDQSCSAAKSPIITLPLTATTAKSPQRSMDASVFDLRRSEAGLLADSKRCSGQVHEQSFCGNRGHLDPVARGDNASTMPSATSSKGSSIAATADNDFYEHDRVGDWQKTPYDKQVSSSREVLNVLDDEIVEGVESSQQKKDEEVNESLNGLPLPPALSAADESDPEELQRWLQVDSDLEHAKVESFLYSDSNGDDNIAGPTCSRQGAPELELENSQVQNPVTKPQEVLSLGRASRTRSLRKGALEQVPSHLSHIVLSYRTNEWAKHISTAAEPEFDETENVSEGADDEMPAHLIERPTTDHVEDSQQNALGVTNPQSNSQQQSLKISFQQPNDLNRTFSGNSGASNSHMPSGRGSWNSTTRLDILPQSSSQARQANTPAAGLSVSTSTSSLTPMLDTRAQQSSSSTAPRQTLTISPIAENAKAEFLLPPGPSLSHSPVAGSAQQDNFLRNRHSQLITRNSPSPAEMMSCQQLRRSASRFSLVESPVANIDDVEPHLPVGSARQLSAQIVNDEDIPLSDRKAILQQQSANLLSESRLTLAENFDPHLPQSPTSAMTAQQRESVLISWRESMRQEVILSSAPKDAVEARRAEMLVEKQQQKMYQQHSEATKRYQEQAFDQAMRRSDMQELHKKALRRMQAYANMHVS